MVATRSWYAAAPRAPDLDDVLRAPVWRESGNGGVSRSGSPSCRMISDTGGARCGTSRASRLGNWPGAQGTLGLTSVARYLGPAPTGADRAGVGDGPAALVPGTVSSGASRARALPGPESTRSPGGTALPGQVD
jgi:hypothetical protein